jgi:general secretion pathway protein G
MLNAVRSHSQKIMRVMKTALSPRHLAQGERGMSLIEIIIVVALLGTLMAYMVSNLIGQSEEAKKDQTKLAMGVISQSLQMYRIHNNRYPTTDQGLNSLLTNPGGDAKGWRGPYIESNKLKDPWDQSFNYESDGRQYKIISGGPDAQIGSEDDIVYPEAEKTGQANP